MDSGDLVLIVPGALLLALLPLIAYWIRKRTDKDPANHS